MLAASLLALFDVLWVWAQYPYSFYLGNTLVPFIVGAVIFAIIGLYMIKSGVRKQDKAQSIAQH